MKLPFKNLASGLVIATLLLVSVVSVCKQSLMTCGMSCSSEMTTAIHFSDGMDGCDHGISACGSLTQDHMSTFAFLYPSMNTDATSSFLAIISLTLLATWVFANTTDRADHARIRTKLRYLQRRLLQAVSPNFLVLAFSEGILNSKIFA